MKLVMAVALSIVASTLLSEAQPVKVPAKNKMKIYLLIGQSNMAGRGKVEQEDKTPHPRVLLFETNNSWVPAVEPLTKDPHKYHGTGPGLAFAKAMADKDPTVTIGLVTAAVGGTPLSRWVKGADLYETAVQRAKLALKDGTLAGILWHQGESDTGTEENANTYGTRLAKMIADLRTDLGAPNVPFVAGELGEFVIERKKGKPVPLAKVVNAALEDLPNHVPLTGCASAKGLKDGGDELHFSSPAQREFGRRYAEIMWNLQHSTNPK
jgi:hypothetical protein